MFQRILVPLDGSFRAERALAVAARVARVSGGSILLLQVVSPPLDYGGGLAQAPFLTEQVIETELAVASGYLDRVAKARELTGLETTTEVLFGLPAQDILAEAQSQHEAAPAGGAAREGNRRAGIAAIASRRSVLSNAGKRRRSGCLPYF